MADEAQSHAAPARTGSGRDRERIRQVHQRTGRVITVAAAEAPFTVDDDRDPAAVLAGIDRILHLTPASK